MSCWHAVLRTAMCLLHHPLPTQTASGRGCACHTMLYRGDSSTFSSMGRPWQSHPGTYFAFRPASSWYLTMMSFSTCGASAYSARTHDQDYIGESSGAFALRAADSR